jgi:hypothetical protein
MAPNNWSKEELLASVEAYAEMYRKQERGEKFVKKKIYDELSAAFDGKRSSKSFEYRMQNISHVVDELGFDFVKGLKPKQNVGDNVYKEIEISIKELKFLPITKTERLSHNDLYKVKANHIFKAVQKLLSESSDHPFGESIEYDVILDDGTKLPPKAVFGIAATEVLGFQVLPKHFTGGIDSPCFKILEESGYVIKPKGGSTKTKKQKQQSDTSIPLDSEDVIWTEGKPRRVMHLRRERSSGLARAKKAEFKSKNGRLYCERCKLDPVDFYGPEVGEACIEAHHTVPLSETSDDRKTTLDDLQCLCASCHRIVHKELRLKDSR